VESYAHARARNARIYAEILDYCACSDAANIIQIEKQGIQIIQMLRQIVGHHTIDYLNAHGTGTEINDAVESMAIQTVFGDKAHQPFVNSTKGTLGHTLGASGGIEAAVTALSIKDNVMHGTITEDIIDNLNVPVNTAYHPVMTALTVSYGFGGHNAALLMGKVDMDD
jgi:3-oxoacyl-[acyl-carrier-protein] synthase II